MSDLISKDKVLRCLKESSEQIDWGQSRNGDAFKHYVGANYRTIAEFKPEPPQWISVKDMMPAETHSMFFKLYGTPKWRNNAMWREESDDVLVAITFEDGSRFVTSGYTQDGKWSTGISKMLPYTVTHWMPLPEPPEVSQNG